MMRVPLSQHASKYLKLLLYKQGYLLISPSIFLTECPSFAPPFTWNL